MCISTLSIIADLQQGMSQVCLFWQWLFLAGDELNYKISPVGVFISIESITKENKYKELLKGSSEIELFMLC